MGEHTVHALNGVSLVIEAGDFVAIMGPSGSGKSTLTQILGLLDVPSTGSYQLNGKEAAKLSEDELAVFRSNEIGFIFQQFHLLPRMSTKENVALPMLYSQKIADPNRSLELLAKVGLQNRGDHRPNELSGGQQQRVAIARSLMNSPKIIIADEPTGNLDSQSEKEIIQVLKDLNAQGITVIIVTHEEEIGMQAKRLIKLRDGVIVSDQRREEFKKSELESHDKNIEKVSLVKEFGEHLVQGYRTLLANKVRTGLSMLGILIGVAAVVSVLAIGKGAQKSIESQLSSLGSNLLILRSGASRVGGISKEAGSAIRLTAEDAQLLKAKISGIKYLSPVVDTRVQVAYKNKNWNTDGVGSLPDYALMKSLTPVAGRFFTEMEDLTRARVAVIGPTLVRELFAGKNPIGEIIKINKISFQVIGVTPQKGSSGWKDQDDMIIFPLNTALYRVFGQTKVNSIEMEMKSSTNLQAIQDEILNLLYTAKKVPLSIREDAFRLMNMAEIQEAVASSGKTMSLLLSAIAAISLLVGGIGIMNIMLVSVTERTKEIGLRKAIGAKRKDIMLQFLAESIVVSAIGGFFGIILAIGATVALTSFAGWVTSISVESIVVAFFFSASIGIIFGLYPARKASLLHPIQALRFE